VGVRTKNRSKFHWHGRDFVWRYDNDQFIRVTSFDKRFGVSYLIDAGAGVGDILAVNGPEFVGIARSEPRPVRLIVPGDLWRAPSTIGVFIDKLLAWCFDPEHELFRYCPAHGPVLSAYYDITAFKMEHFLSQCVEAIELSGVSAKGTGQLALQLAGNPHCVLPLVEHYARWAADDNQEVIREVVRTAGLMVSG